MATFTVVGSNETILNVEIDDEEAELVASLPWYVDRDGYVRSRRYGFRIGNLVLDVPDNHVVEHIDGDKLDARRDNLRDLGRSWTTDLP